MIEQGTKHMGLDHGLRKHHYVKNWEHMPPAERRSITVLKGGTPDSSIKSDRIVSIEEEVITWRKANHIHNWFVQNVQRGTDDCATYRVSVDQLRRLVEHCKAVLDGSQLVPGKVWAGSVFANGEMTEQYADGLKLKDASIAQELLPTASGFFFGSTEYDQWYIEDLRETVRVLEPELADESRSKSFEYWSSW